MAQTEQTEAHMAFHCAGVQDFLQQMGGGVNHDLLAKGQRLYEQCPALWLRGVPLLPEGYVAPDTYQWHSPMIADVVRSQQMQM